jgi:hypothetical protein
LASNDELAHYGLTPTAFEHLIAPDLVGLDGIGRLIDEIRTNSAMRSALLLRTATTLRERFKALPFDASTAEPITIEAQDALVLLDLLLRRLG